MLKIVAYLVVFLLGAGAGIWWSVSNPEAAANVQAAEQQQAAKIQAAVSQAKIDLLQKFLASSDSNSNSNSTANSSSNSPDSGYQHMLDDEQKKLTDAKKQLTGGN